MGNVSASSQKSGMPPPSPPPKETPTVFDLTPQKEELENPGPLEDLHKKCKELFPLNFEGGKVGVQKGISSRFQVTHSVTLSSLTPSGYKFGATYVGTKPGQTPTDQFPVLYGDIDPSGCVNANMIHRLSDRTYAKFSAQIQGSKFVHSQANIDYKGDNYTASIQMGGLDFISSSGMFVAHYLQKVSKNLDLGAEIAYHRSYQLPGKQVAITSLAGRYTGDDYSVSGTLGLTGLHLCYYQKASHQLQLGVELETNFRMQESVATMVYQADIPKAELVFKGMVDTNWNVGATFEKRLPPLPFTVNISGILHHPKNQFRLGLGFIIG